MNPCSSPFSSPPCLLFAVYFLYRSASIHSFFSATQEREVRHEHDMKRDENGTNAEDDERLHLGREGGHSQHRIVHAADATGKEIERTLLTQVKENLVLPFSLFFPV